MTRIEAPYFLNYGSLKECLYWEVTCLEEAA